eukprot:3901107-Pyramimonas_sp.AAC.1
MVATDRSSSCECVASSRMGRWKAGAIFTNSAPNVSRRVLASACAGLTLSEALVAPRQGRPPTCVSSASVARCGSKLFLKHRLGALPTCGDASSELELARCAELAWPHSVRPRYKTASQCSGSLELVSGVRFRKGNRMARATPPDMPSQFVGE